MPEPDPRTTDTTGEKKTVLMKTPSAPTRPAQTRSTVQRHRLGIVALLVSAAVVLAACSTSAPAKKKAKKKEGAGATTTTTAPGATTSTAPGSSSSGGGSTSGGGGGAAGSTAAHAATVGASGPCAGSTPGGVLGGSCDLQTPALQLTGAGANSIAPFFSKVFYVYNQSNHNVSVNYSPAGSGVGVTDIKNNSVEFADSEIPISPVPATGNNGTILQLPVDLGGVALSYNIPGAPANMQLTPDQIAKIFLGVGSGKPYTYWSDVNASLPHTQITPVFRADTSGPGYDLDQYLIDTSPAWVSAIGTNKASTTWPEKNAQGGVGQQLNTGVASYISQTPGAIGYVEFAYAQQAGFTNVALQNASGNYVTPSVSSIAAAGAQASGLSEANFNFVDGTGAAYPLANFSWTLIYVNQSNVNLAVVLGKLFDWVTTTGQSQATALGYAPLPANAVSLAHQTLLRLQTPTGQKIFG
jgi:phosphate transport system substrate-binding protein